MPRYRIEILSVPAGGASENVNVVAFKPYVDGSCTTPSTATRIEAVFAGATCNVNATVESSPLNVSVRNVAVCNGFPM